MKTEEKAKRYDEALERAKRMFSEKELNYLFPELKESEGERIRKAIRGWIYTRPSSFFDNGISKEQFLSWLEKQDNTDLEFFENSENEKREFVGYGFLKCKGDFLSFKEGENYWLEYVGKDNYNVRSDNLLGQTFHITPQQLYTVFRPTTAKDILVWLERQGEKPQGKSALEAIKEEKVDNANKIEPKDYSNIDPHFFKATDKAEPKFHEGDWIIRSAEGFKHNTYLIKEIKDYYVCEELKGRRVTFTFNDVHKNFKLWDISDAKDGDVLASGQVIFIFKVIRNRWLYCHCSVHNDGSFIAESYDMMTYKYFGEVHPATKEQHDTLEKAMTDAGYTFDFEKKELKKIGQKFNIGDEIKTANEEPLTITKIDEKGYWSEDLFICGFDDAAKWELVGQKLAWSEEDENNLIREKNFEELLKKFCKEYYNYDYPKQFQEGTGDPAMPHIIEAAKYFYEMGRVN